MNRFLKILFIYIPIMIITEFVLVYANLYFKSDEQMYAMVPISLGVITVHIVSNVIICICSYKKKHSVFGVNCFMFVTNFIYAGINICVGWKNGYFNPPKSVVFFLYSCLLISAAMAFVSTIATIMYKYINLIKRIKGK